MKIEDWDNKISDWRFAGEGEECDLCGEFPDGCLCECDYCREKECDCEELSGK